MDTVFISITSPRPRDLRLSHGRRKPALRASGIPGAEIHADAVSLQLGEVVRYLFRPHNGSALAGDGSGDSHPQFALSEAVPAQPVSGLIEHINPSRRNVSVLGVNFPRTSASDLADEGKPAVANTDVRANPWIPTPIQHPTIADDHVVDVRR